MSAIKVKQFLARGLNAAINLDKLIQERRDRYVLSYHRVLPTIQAKNDGVHHSLWITPESLSSQIRWMLSVGKIVDFSQLTDFTITNDRPLFALTFDDGWEDNYCYALPIIKQYQVTATIFLATEAVESGDLFWPQDIATKTMQLLLKGRSECVVKALIEAWPQVVPSTYIRKSDTMEMVERWIEALKLVSEEERVQRVADYYRRLQLSTTPLSGYIMGWDEAREMQKYKIYFGSHTHRHTILKGMSDELIEQELYISRKLISENLQIDVNSFCFPNGRYNGKEGAILSRCGYRYGFRIDNISLRNCTDILYIPRFLTSECKYLNPAFFKLCLLEAPLYKSKPHNPNVEDE